MKRVLQVGCVLWIILWTFFLIQVPGFNGDTIFYMGVVTEYEESSSEKIHQVVYSTLKEEASEYKYENLVGSNDYLKNCFSDADFFFDQLSFYRVKPLYTFLIYALHKVGFKMTHAMIFLSIASFWGIVFFTFYWLKTFFEINYSAITGLLFSIFYPLVMLARLFSPDALSNLLILISFYFFINHQKKYRWILFCLLAVLIRVDNIIVLLMMFIFSSIDKKTFFSINKKLIGNLGLAAVVSFLIVALLTFFVGNNFDWLMKFSHMFSVNDYISYLKGVPDGIIRRSSFPLILIMVAFCFPIIKKESWVILTLISCIIFLRLILFPSFQERFFIAFEIIILIIIAQSLQQAGLINLIKQID